MSEIPNTVAKFDVWFDAETGILSITAVGQLTAIGIMGVVGKYYPQYQFNGVLWNLMDAELGSVTDVDFQNIAKTTRPLLPEVASRTAYVTSSIQAYTRICAYMSKTVEMRVPVEYRAFRQLSEALSWLIGAK